MLRAVKVRLYPNSHQKQLLHQHFGACRLVYNLLLDAKMKAYECGDKLSAYDLKKRLVSMKEASPDKWMKKIDSTALQLSVLNIDRAYKNFFNGSGYPKFKSKHNSRQSYQTINAKIKDSKLYLPKIGYIKAKFHRKITTIKTVTISCEANQYYASILTEFEELKPVNNNQEVALDMGVKVFAKLSNNQEIKPIDFSKDYKRVEVLQKQLSRKQKNSNNFKKQKLKLQKKYLKIKNRRKDFLHKETKKLSIYKTVVVEDLKIKNMSKSAKGNKVSHGKNVKQKSGLNRSILKQSWGMFLKILEYKLKQNGNELIKVNPQYTSLQCSRCGYIDKSNRESQSVFKCKACGYEANADYNASINILHRGTTRDVPVIKSA